MASQNTSQLFQLYMEQFFKFPKDIKNDIIYCQRALRDHIKVHQLVLDVFAQQAVKTPAHRDSILHEIESEIFEINAEQHFLLLRLRRVIDEFFKMLQKNNVPIEPSTINALISREVVPLINDSNLKILPVSVAPRFSEEMLIQKYFDVQEEQTITVDEHGCEIIDLCDDDVEMNQASAFLVTSHKKTKKQPIDPLAQNHQKSQESLLKPIEERLSHSSSSSSKMHSTEAIQFVEVQMNDVPATETSKSVKLSRMNLRQALKKAHTIASGQGTNTNSKTTDGETIKNKKSPLKQQHVLDKNAGIGQAFVATITRKTQNESKSKASRSNGNSANLASNVIEPKSPDSTHSSSDDSNVERDPTSPHPFWPDEMAETRVFAAEYGKEMFLRIFDLFTPEVLVQLQQRRSKRKRRTVHSKCSDFHYGRIESGKGSKDNKKEVKTFLLSPQAKAKRPKRASAEKTEESPATSRSNSSSPNEKRNCNECLKNNGLLDQCMECKSYYHQSCHREEDDVKTNVSKPQASADDNKLCPACKLKAMKVLKKEKVQQKNLQNTAKELEHEMTTLIDRRQKLQDASKLYKMKMKNMLDMVKTIKSISPSNDDSSE